MRALVLIAVLACATAAHAEGSRESRYGPAPERAPKAMNGRAPGYTGQAYTGRSLGWSGKREMAAPTAQAASQAQPWWARSAPQAPQPPQAPQAPQARPAFQPQTPVYAPQAPQARALPQSIYDAPPAPAAPMAQAPLYQPQQQASLPNGQVGARSYSVGRQFGMAPDAIPAAGPPRMVLIAPPASAPEDEDKPREDGEWSAPSHRAKPDKDGQ